jgi:Zn-dependent protease
MANRTQTESHYAIKVLTAAGIPVRIHFTFFLLLVYVAFASRPHALDAVLLVCALFVCVVLHEFGHALMAKKYGIETADITLYPFGGVAVIKSRPAAAAEFWIALAGPFVNFVIAALLLPLVLMEHHPTTVTAADPFAPGMFLDSILAANLFIAVFNLIPAFPMDGGRVLRAVLAMSVKEPRATEISAIVGQLLAVGMFFIAVADQNIVLILIALFVFFGAGQEVSMSRTHTVLSGHTVRDAMQVQFATINSGETIQEAARKLLAEGQHAFPVVAGEEVIGVLSRNDIARGLASGLPDDYVAGFMQRDVLRFPIDAPLEEVLEAAAAARFSAALVMDGERLAGLLTVEGLSEFMMLQHARARAR